MFENPNLDNYLARAQSFLDRQDYGGAVQVLQDVIEGKTIEVFATRAEDEAGAEGADPAKPSVGSGGQPGAAKPNKLDDFIRNRGSGNSAAAKAQIDTSELDARNAVFSRNGRMYRPVRRLCHELLSRMPDVGIQIYRTAHEFAAEELLREAIASGSSTALEQVANRYFITLPAGRAMMLLSDRLMHEGRYRAAVQVLRDLLEIYPDQNRKALGIRDVWCEFKVALCLRLAGERDAARGAVEQLANEHAEESLRIRGELESVRDLPQSKLFARDTAAIEAAPDRASGVSWLRAAEGSDGDALESLVPLWQYRFANPEPYKDPKPSGRRNGWSQGARANTMPFAKRYGPGTSVTFARERDGDYSVPRAVFLEHYRLRLADAATGLLLREGDGQNEPPIARQNHPRVRIAAADRALLRPVQDEERRYVIIGHESNTTSSQEALKSSTLVAYDKDTWERTWSSENWQNGSDGLQGVTFLAAPTVFGERLLLPSLRREAYTLECLDRKTGKPLWNTPIHAGGSEFFKAPGCQIVVRGGHAYIATNAGCVAAVDAFAGDLRWARRYERHDSVHKRRKKKRARTARNVRNGYQSFAQAALASFLPSDLILHGGLLIVAACDSELILAIEAASGEPIWMLDGNTRYAPYGRLTEVIGCNDKHLFALSASHLVCIELDGGLVRWQQKLPSWGGPKYSGRGRSVVMGSTVLVPNQREVLVFDGDNQKPMRRLTLPAFDESREPLSGSCHLVSDGPWLAVGFQGGVEVFSSASALAELAETVEDPLRKASYLTRSGAPGQAEVVLTQMIAASKDKSLRHRAGGQLLALVNARATKLARAGDVPAAMQAMDSLRDVLSDRPARLNWHLARIEIAKEAGDLSAHEREQQSLYDYMEGRG